MNLTPREKDKLLVAMAAIVARRRLERGVRLNHPEAIALITDHVVEGARDGRSVADLMKSGAEVVSRAQVFTPRAASRASSGIRPNGATSCAIRRRCTMSERCPWTRPCSRNAVRSTPPSARR